MERPKSDIDVYIIIGISNDFIFGIYKTNEKENQERYTFSD